MYKCTECGMEYEVKPDYCDCGNDEFVLTIEKTSEPVADIQCSEQPEQTEKIVESLEKSYNSGCAKQHTGEIKEQVKYKLPVSPFALCVFVICIIAAVLILFVWNPKTEVTSADEPSTKQMVNRQIPSIDKLWKDPVIVSKPEKPVQKPEPVVSQPKTTPVVKTVKQQQPKKTTTVPLTRKTSTSKSTTQQKNTQKPVVQNQTVKQPSAAEIEAQKAAEAAKKAAEAKQKAENEAKLAAEKAKQAALAKQEYASYKISLRNTIAKKIDFTKVVGDGSCVVSFKLDSTGKLVNRTFAQQSSNLTLNNAVYKAVMATPTFVQPPSAYKNETLKLNITFNNGNFAITLE